MYLLLGHEDHAEGQVVHEGVALAVDHFHGPVGFLLEALVLGFGDHAFDGLLTGGADAGNDHVFGVVQVLIENNFAPYAKGFEAVFGWGMLLLCAVGTAVLTLIPWRTPVDSFKPLDLVEHEEVK